MSLFDRPTAQPENLSTRVVKAKRWLSDFLQRQDHSDQELSKDSSAKTSVPRKDLKPSTETKVSVVNIDGNRDAHNVFEHSFGGNLQQSQRQLEKMLATIQQCPSAGGDLQVIHVSVELEDDFDTTVVNALAESLRLDDEFFLDHFLPSLPSDAERLYEGEELIGVVPIPSEHRYFRLKDCGGRNTSVAVVNREFVEKGFSPMNTVFILSPLITPTTQISYLPSSVYTGARFRGNRSGRIVSSDVVQLSVAYVHPMVKLVLKDYAEFLRQLQNENPDTNLLEATQQRLEFCKHNLDVLGGEDISRIAQLLQDFAYLLGQVQKLKQRAKEQLDREIQHQQSTAAEKQNNFAKTQNQLAEMHLKTAKEGNKEVHASLILAESAQRLTILAFIFIPLNFASSIFAMHLTAVGFSDGLELWRFFAVAVPLEVVVLIVAIVSGPLVRFAKDYIPGAGNDLESMK